MEVGIPYIQKKLKCAGGCCGRKRDVGQREQAKIEVDEVLKQSVAKEYVLYSRANCVHRDPSAAWHHIAGRISPLTSTRISARLKRAGNTVRP